MNLPSVSVAMFFALLIVAVDVAIADEPHDSNGQLSPIATAMVSNHCLDCHNRDDATAGIDLEAISTESVSDHSAVWEKVVKKLRAGQMPPSESRRPAESTIAEVLSSLERSLDEIAALHPQPGRAETFRRLTRFEYQNAIRDLLSLDVDVTALLPADSVSHGFDNITVGELSPTLVGRYVAAAQKISRLAIGRSLQSPDVKTFRIPPDVTQEERVEGLPIGTRGGTLMTHTFPQDGEYEIQVRLARDRNEQVEGLSEAHELEMLVDLDRVKLLTVKPSRHSVDSSDEYNPTTDEQVDQHLSARISVTAGPHEIGVAFLKKPSSLLETKRQPLNVHFNMYRHPRLSPAVYQVSITGPLTATGSGDTPSRRKVFVCRPNRTGDEQECAKRIISTLLRRACRQPIDEADMVGPMAMYRQVRDQAVFEQGELRAGRAGAGRSGAGWL